MNHSPKSLDPRLNLIYNKIFAITDLFRQSALQLIEVDDGITGVQHVQLAVEGVLQHASFPQKHLPYCIQELRTPVRTS